MMPRITLCLATGIGNTVLMLPVAQALKSIGYKVRFLVYPKTTYVIGVLAGYKYSIGTTTKGLVGIPLLWKNHINNKVSKDQIIADKLNFREHHEVEANMTIARKLGYSKATPMPKLRLVTPKLNNTIMIATGCKKGDIWKKKQYPHWLELCQKLVNAGYILSFVGLTKDSEDWMKDFGINLCGMLPLRETINWTAGAKAVITIDNGIGHISAALGKLTNVIFGPTLETKNRPLGPRVNIIKKIIPCSPCQLSRRWIRCSEYKCMDLDADTIMKQLILTDPVCPVGPVEPILGENNVNNAECS